MYTINSNSGKISHGTKKYVVDTASDILELPINDAAPGSLAFVIDTSTYYMLNHQGQWKKVTLSSGSGSGSGGGGTESPDDIIYDGGII